MAGEYINLKRYEDALPLLKKIIRLEPTYAKAYFNLATIREAEGRRKQALSLALKAYRHDIHDPRNAQLVGYLYLRSGNYAKGLSYYDIFLRLRPTFKNAQEYVKVLTLVLGKTGNREIVKSFSKTLREVGHEDVYQAIWERSP